MEMHKGHSPTSSTIRCWVRPGGDVWAEAGEEGVDATAEGAGAFAVNHPDCQDALAAAFFKPCGEQVREIAGTVGVEVEVAGDLDPDGAIVFGHWPVADTR